jgi:hypothetical protein
MPGGETGASRSRPWIVLSITRNEPPTNSVGSADPKDRKFPSCRVTPARRLLALTTSTGKMTMNINISFSQKKGESTG